MSSHGKVKNLENSSFMDSLWETKFSENQISQEIKILIISKP